MTKINNITREKIAVVLLKYRFKPHGEALAARSDALFNEAYELVYDAETRKIMAKLTNLHPNAFPTLDNVCCKANGWNLSVGSVAIGYSKVSFPSQTKKRPYLQNGLRKFDFSNDPFAEKLTEFAIDCKAFKEAINTAYYELKSALGQINSVKQLRTAWPEVLPLIEHLLPAPGLITYLPAIQFVTLNAAYGLPPVVEAAL